MTELFEKFGPLGLALVVFISMYIKQNRRMAELENKRFEDYRATIKDYSDLVQSINVTINQLTICMRELKSTLDRIERKLE